MFRLRNTGIESPGRCKYKLGAGAVGIAIALVYISGDIGGPHNAPAVHQGDGWEGNFQARISRLARDSSRSAHPSLAPSKEGDHPWNQSARTQLLRNLSVRAWVRCRVGDLRLRVEL